MWVVDAVQGAGLRAFFDRLDLLEINEEVLLLYCSAALVLL